MQEITLVEQLNELTLISIKERLIITYKISMGTILHTCIVSLTFLTKQPNYRCSLTIGVSTKISTKLIHLDISKCINKNLSI